MKVLNLGCGEVVVNDWVNVDINPVSRDVLRMNFLKRFDFPRDYFDAVYMSHVLEHIQIADVLELTGRIHEILRPGGVFRCVVPDLEDLARTYLEELESERKSGQNSWRRKWLTIELIDQLSREQAGGLMKVWFDDVAINSQEVADYVYFRVGEKIKVKEEESDDEICLPLLAAEASRRNKQNTSFLSRNKTVSRGEKHLWMWDELSLKELSEKAGFKQFERYSAYTSSLGETFRRVDLDVSNNPRKGKNSLYVEFIK